MLIVTLCVAAVVFCLDKYNQQRRRRGRHYRRINNAVDFSFPGVDVPIPRPIDDDFDDDAAETPWT